VQSEFALGIHKPCGAWKVEPNDGTYAVTEDGRQTYIEYAAPEHVPTLMAQWLAELNRSVGTALSETEAISAYARLHLGFVHIHPFWDGNGRLARLVSNIPPIAYIDTLAGYGQATGQLTTATGVWPSRASDAAFRAFCQRSYRATHNLIEQAKIRQAERAIRMWSVSARSVKTTQ